jgi:putative ATPase
MSGDRSPGLWGDDEGSGEGPLALNAAQGPSADASPGGEDRRPLPERLRPRHLSEVIGQRHLLGPGKPLRVAHETGRLHSMILWGPPGVGKTTLARLLASGVQAQLVVLSAVLAGVKDIREAVAQAQALRAQGRSTIVFVDEVHRFNKAQQDAFLPHVESGLFTFIGATTENPSFEVNSALLSRASVHVLKSLTDEELSQLLDRAQQVVQGPVLSDGARRRLLQHADGDARRLLNAYEAVLDALAEPSGQEIGEEALERALGDPLRRFDKAGDAFYDAISALHKSVRGSDPDAALYWLARMLDGGVDPRYIVRRVLRMASEDIGLADPRAQDLALQAAEVFERLGSPEGELAIAQAVTYLAVAPKSNAVYTAWKSARALVSMDGTRPVPDRLRNAPTRLMAQMGHGKGYRYAHDEPGGFAAGESYLPDDLPPVIFYQPVERGLEIRIGARLQELRAANQSAREGDNRNLGSEVPAARRPVGPDDVLSG